MIYFSDLLDVVNNILTFTAPPSFEEAINCGPRIIKEPDDDDYAVCSLYTPKYPVFKGDQYASFPNQIHSMYPPTGSQYQGYYQASPTQPTNPPYPMSSGSSSSGGPPYPTSPSSPASESRQQLLPQGGGSPSAPAAGPPYPMKQ